MINAIDQTVKSPSKTYRAALSPTNAQTLAAIMKSGNPTEIITLNKGSSSSLFRNDKKIVSSGIKPTITESSPEMMYSPRGFAIFRL